MLPVPNGLPPDLSALTEPMAIGWHAVGRSEIGKRDVAIVIGCGPIGLAVICLLKARGVRTVVASDFSAARRALATRCGAEVVVDPTQASPYEAGDRGHLNTMPAAVELALSTMEKLQRLPVPWQHLWRTIDTLWHQAQAAGDLRVRRGAGHDRRHHRLSAAVLPRRGRRCVHGSGQDPAVDGDHKEIDLRFVVGCTPLEFRDTLHGLAEGKVNAAPLATGVVGLQGVASAFDALASPEEHAKILIDPRSAAGKTGDAAPSSLTISGARHGQCLCLPRPCRDRLGLAVVCPRAGPVTWLIQCRASVTA